MSSTDSAIHATLESESGARIACVLKRHLSPSTVGLIARSLPLCGNLHSMGASVVYFETNLKSGIERARTEFRRGEIAFYPAEGSICFMHNDAELRNAMSPIGVMPGYAGGLEELGSGDVLRLAVGA